MAIPFKNAAIATIHLALNNDEYRPLLSQLDDQLSAATPATLFAGNNPTLTNYQYDYQGVGAGTWLDVDGVNPPTMPLLRLIDQVTGLPVYLFVYNGVLTIGSI